jgi:protein required for attachment to host cells
MAKQLVAVIDGARARYYVVGTRTGLGGAERNKLEEVASLINPEHRVKDAELYSESRPGVRQAPAGGPGHGVHDHRDAHADEVERRFASMVLKELADQIRQHDANNVILAAAPRMLGFLRDNRTPLPQIPIGELPKHLTELSPHDLCERLEADGLLSA